MEPARKELFPFCHSNQYGLLSLLFHPLQLCFCSGKVFEDFEFVVHHHVVNSAFTPHFLVQHQGTVSPVYEQRL